MTVGAGRRSHTRAWPKFAERIPSGGPPQSLPAAPDAPRPPRSIPVMTDDVVENRFEVSIAPELEGGVYASFANLWHGPDVFTIDFAALSAPPERGEDENGHGFNRFQTRVVSRVRIPPSQVFELMKALEIQLSAWETETGHKPSPPPQA